MKQLFSLAAIIFLLASCTKNVSHPKNGNANQLTQFTSAANVSNAGTCIDPNGKPEESDYGIAIDPDGKPQNNDSGTSLDPSGKPGSDEGIVIDGNGKP